MAGLISHILKKQYARTMREAYTFARLSAASHPATHVLDCGSNNGRERLESFGSYPPNSSFHYCGLEWNSDAVEKGKKKGLDIRVSNLNEPLPIESCSQDCVVAFSVLEHLLMPCSFIIECHRTLKPGGRLVLLTPNISTYFTAFQILLGQMPSSGPHPDSNRLIQLGEPAQVSNVTRDNVTSSTTQHRHLVVFSYKALRKFLSMTGFTINAAKGFGYYPLPVWLQPLFERLDPYHCHQMVFVCTKQNEP
ncbi:MAG: class I SAM-dependent methyltransferase [Gammaproteobacteria bacterium]